MPAPQIKSFARKSGKSEAEVEKLYDKAKEQAKKAGKKEGNDDFYAYTVGVLKKMLGIKESLNELFAPIAPGETAEDWVRDLEGSDDCPTPGRKLRSKGKGQGLGIGRGRGPIGRRQYEDDRYRIVLNGEEVQMVRNGAQVPLGESDAVDSVRARVQDLLDHNIDTAFDLGGFVGTLAEIEQQVFRDWLLFCNGGKVTVYATDEVTSDV